MILKLIDWWLIRRGFVRILESDTLDAVPRRIRELTGAALPLCRKVNPLKHSGEWKRHQVYARMLKSFPDDPKRDISWAIERAVRQL